MTWAPENEFNAAPQELDCIGEQFHNISQPLTALECGLEIALRQERDAARLRARLQSALTSTQTLRQRLMELRLLLDAGDPGDTSVPVAIDELLLRLRDGFIPLARHRRIAFSVRCAPALLHGNAERLHWGFFSLLEFLVAYSLPRQALSLAGLAGVNGLFLVRFAVRGKGDGPKPQAEQLSSAANLNFRIARRTIQAAGGELLFRGQHGGCSAGEVRLRLAPRDNRMVKEG